MRMLYTIGQCLNMFNVLNFSVVKNGIIET